MKKANLILYNGVIYTASRDSFCESLAIKNDVILCAGSYCECEKYRDDNTKLIDLEQKLVLPGLIDSHVHPETVVKSKWRVQLPEFEDKESLLKYVEDYCSRHSVAELPYFFGECYPSDMFDEKGPKKEWIDEYVSDRPVRLQDFTDHACWYNSKALKLMGINNENCSADTAPYFVADENGEPTGWVKEPLLGENYEETMYQRIGWHPPEEVSEEMLKPFLDFLKSHGVIAIFDGITEGENAIRTFYEMDIKGSLNMYYEGSCLLEAFADLDSCVHQLKEWRKKYSTEHVGIHTVKLFLDQTNEMGTGAYIDPLINDTSGENTGEINFSEEELQAILRRLNEEGLDLHVHVVGDRGFRTACDAYAKAKEEASRRGEKWKIYMTLAHCELVHPDDRKKPAQQGIIINWSCHWSGGYFGDAAINYLGEERWNSMYAFNEMINSGAVFTCSSDVIGDCEAKRANPYFGMQTAITRIDPDCPLNDKKYPGSVRPDAEESLSLMTLLQGYTSNGAIALRIDDKAGSLEAGKKANLVIFEDNILEMPAEQLKDARVSRLMFEGVFLYN